MGDVLLKVSDIVKRFPGTIALNHAQLEVRCGEVHALVGENGAGKSTMMNIISGVFKADEGTMLFDGREGFFSNPTESMNAGIGFVHQELSLCNHLSVSENVFMGRVKETAGNMINWNLLHEKTDKILKHLNADFKGSDIVQTLSIAQMQLVEIARAISLNAKLIILDEPTSSLTDKETDIFFKNIRKLKAEGTAFIYISHRLSEIEELCDRVTVMRDGQYIMTSEVKDTTKEELVNNMVGRTVGAMYPDKSNVRSDEELLRVENFTGFRFDNASFTLHKGEILGFSGLVGSGRSELMRGVCSIDRKKTGKIYLKGKETQFSSYEAAIQQGICYMTEDRKKDGLFLQMPVYANITVSVLKDISKNGILSLEKEKEVSDEQVKAIGVKVANTTQKINSLSGGNQQKAMIGKWLASHPQIFILDEPTRGIDVVAKSEIHKILRKLCNEGMGIIVISSELPEIMGLSDRVIVMHEGEIQGELQGDDITEENIMTLASGLELKKAVNS